MVVCADANAKSRLWGGDTVDDKGGKLIDFVMQEDLDIINRPNTLPTCIGAGKQRDREKTGGTWIDVTLASQKIAGQIEDWTVRDGWTTSDHRLIDFKIRLRKADRQSSALNTRFNTKKTD